MLRTSRLLILVPVFLLVASPARSQWIPNGEPICVVPGQQDGPVIVPDGLGNVIIAWQDGRNPNDALGPDVYAIKLTPSGTIAPGWTVNGSPVCTALGDESVLDMIPDGHGGAFIAWHDYRQGSATVKDIYVQRITDVGISAPGWPANGQPACRAIHDQNNPRLCNDGADGAFVVWDDERGGAADIYAQRLSPTGGIASGWPADGAPIGAGMGCPRILADGVGGAFITWATSTIVLVERITASGVPVAGWPSTGLAVSPPIVRGLADPTIASDGAGGAFVAWQDASGSTGFDVFLNRINADGTTASGWPSKGIAVCSAPGDQAGPGAHSGCAGPSIIPDGAGGAIITWEDNRGSDQDIYAERILPNGTVAPGWPGDGAPVCRAPGMQWLVDQIPDGAGGAIITWRDQRSDTSHIYAQHLNGVGQVNPGWANDGNPVSVAPFFQLTPRIASDGVGGAVIVWTDYRNVLDSSGPSDIYAQRIFADSPVPALPALANAQVGPGEVRLEWYASDGADAFQVDRRMADSDWIDLGSPTSSGDGLVTYEDRGLRPGRYAYRLALGASYTAESWVDVPSGATLALAGFEPNPAAGRLQVAFSLSANSPATIEIFDVGGRRVATCEVGSLGAGDHLLTIPPSEGMASGIYWVRLTQSGREITKRGVFAR